MTELGAPVQRQRRLVVADSKSASPTDRAEARPVDAKTGEVGDHSVGALLSE